MTPSRGSVVETVQRHIEAYNDVDIDRFVGTFAADAEVTPLEPDARPAAVGREEIREEYTPLFEDNPSLHCEVETTIAVGKTVAVHERVSTGEGAPVECLGIYRVEEGAITNLWLAYD